MGGTSGHQVTWHRPLPPPGACGSGDGLGDTGEALGPPGALVTWGPESGSWRRGPKQSCCLGREGVGDGGGQVREPDCGPSVGRKGLQKKCKPIADIQLATCHSLCRRRLSWPASGTSDGSLERKASFCTELTGFVSLTCCGLSQTSEAARGVGRGPESAGRGFPESRKCTVVTHRGCAQQAGSVGMVAGGERTS